MARNGGAASTKRAVGCLSCKRGRKEEAKGMNGGKVAKYPMFSIKRVIRRASGD